MIAAPTACRRTGSGTLSLPCAGFFSPFPHGTGPLSVSYEYLALPDGPGGFTQDYTCPALLRSTLRRRMLRIRGFHPLRRRFPAASPRMPASDIAFLQPRTRLDGCGLGSSPVARHYWGNHSYFLFLRLLRCFSSPRSPPAHGGMPSLQDGGFSHSDTRGSKAACASPRIFAACHVLHRL